MNNRLKTLKSVLVQAKKNIRKAVGYVYRSGIHVLVEQEAPNGKTYQESYFLASEIRFGSPDVQRIVLHDTDLLIMGQLNAVDFYEESNSPWWEKLGIKHRCAIFRFKDEFMLPAYEYSDVNEGRWIGNYGIHVCIQGTGYWHDGSKFSSFDKNTALAVSYDAEKHSKPIRW